jgi:hypothetical protein
MDRDRRLWRADKEQTPRAAPLRAVTGFATKSESIKICLPLGCGSFWLKQECSSLDVSLRYASVQKFFLSFQKSSATRQMRIFRGSPDLTVIPSIMIFNGVNPVDAPACLKYVFHSIVSKNVILSCILPYSNS